MLLTGPFAMLSMPSFDFHLPPCTEGFLIHPSPLWQLPLWQLPLFPSVAQFPCVDDVKVDRCNIYKALLKSLFPGVLPDKDQMALTKYLSIWLGLWHHHTSLWLYTISLYQFAADVTSWEDLNGKQHRRTFLHLELQRRAPFCYLWPHYQFQTIKAVDRDEVLEVNPLCSWHVCLSKVDLRRSRRTFSKTFFLLCWLRLSLCSSLGVDDSCLSLG